MSPTIGNCIKIGFIDKGPGDFKEIVITVVG